MTGSSLITVMTASAGEGQGRFASDALRSQRERLAALLHDLDADAWDAPSRCTEWSVHQMVRHLCDMTLKATALLDGALPQEVAADGMDPRTTPASWLAGSAGERPRQTITLFEDATAAMLAAVDRHSAGAAADVHWLYGPVPWSIAVLHVMWDAWVHERDIVLSLGRSQESPAIESRAAAAYGLVMAALPTLVAETTFDDTVVLSGSGGGLFRIEARSDPRSGPQLSMAGYPANGMIMITVDDEGGVGDVEPLRGALVEVVDSLVGRAPELAAALHGPAERVERLGMLRAFMLLPVA